MELHVALVVEAVAAAVPDREAVVWRSTRRTYAELVDRSQRLAAVLLGAGLRTDDLALLYLTNCPEYLEGMLGGFRAGVGPANVNYRYTEAEVAYLVADSHARAAVVHRRFAANLADAGLDVLLVVEDGSGADVPGHAVDYEQALAAADPAVAAARAAGPDDLYVVYTGGTTGRPKGVLWRQADFLAGALGVTGTYESLAAAAPASTLRALAAPPLMHGAAHWNALSCLAAGGTVVLQDHPERFDADDVLTAVERERCTSLNIVGDAFGIPLADAIAARPYDLTSLRHLVTGGAVLSASTKARLAELVPGLRIVDIVGSSESGRQGMSRGAGAGRFDRSGAATVLRDDRTGPLDPADTTTVGWLAQSGPIPLGYLGDPEKTAATFPTVGGTRYVVAGDRARWSAEEPGAIELLGRESATINTGGEKVFAEEVEAALRAHPAVADAAVAGRPHERFGAEVVAVVALRPGCDDVTDDDLREACAADLARYKLPRAFVRVEHVQRTASGKTDHAWAKAVVAGSAP